MNDVLNKINVILKKKKKLPVRESVLVVFCGSAFYIPNLFRMPPKQQASKKTEQKKKDKVADDRTFGLKNKKGAKQQKYVQQVVAQVRFVAPCSFS